MAKLVNKKYDSFLINDLSIVDASLELNKVDNANEELKIVKNLLKNEHELVNTLTSSHISKEEKYSLIEDIFKENISEQMVELLKKIFVKYTDVLVVTAITVVPMEESSQEKLIDILGKKYKKDVILLNEVDKSIIGGVLLKIGDKVLDGTLEGELKTIKRTLKEVSM